MAEKRYIRGRTESGDYYSATEELWEAYRKSVATDWKLAMKLEEGENPDFYYDPQE